MWAFSKHPPPVSPLAHSFLGIEDIFAIGMIECKVLLHYSWRLAIDCRVGLRWHFRCGWPILKPRPGLDFPSEKSGVVFLNFFQKVEKYARTIKNDVFGDCSENSIVLR